jgi:DNA invertase Pin-like site-specific DNA recombinase
MPRMRHEAVAEQRTKIDRWASRNGVRIDAWHEERAVGEESIYSARPVLMDAVASLRSQGAGAALVIASRELFDVFDQAIVERLARRYGGRVVAADGRRADRDVLRLVTMLESHEQAISSTRTRAERRRCEATGSPFGEAPWGFRRSADGTRVVRDPREQRALAIAAHMRANGLTLREITEELARLDLRSRRGTPIRIARVHEMLRDMATNPRYERFRRILQRQSRASSR